MRSSYIALALPLYVASFTPAFAQTGAQQPAMTPEQAIQLFAEAGFPLQGGQTVNRCGNASNPRVAFIDLNDDRLAEAHIADVDPKCYGKPGAYFAIMAQQANGTWKRLIAEDGIVSFQRKRSAGWNDLSLAARYSACPGLRRFNGADYGTSLCTVTLPVQAAPSPAAAALSPSTAATALTGSRADRLAQVLRNVVLQSSSRSWDAIRAAFPGARWEARRTQPPNYYGATHTQTGSINLGGSMYGIGIDGRSDRVVQVQITSPGDDLLAWEAVASSLNLIGARPRNIGCHSPTGFGYVRLATDGQSAVLHKFVNYGSRVPSTDYYSFQLDDPFDGRSEAEVAADRSLC